MSRMTLGEDCPEARLRAPLEEVQYPSSGGSSRDGGAAAEVTEEEEVERKSSCSLEVDGAGEVETKMGPGRMWLAEDVAEAEADPLAVEPLGPGERDVTNKYTVKLQLRNVLKVVTLTSSSP